MVKLRSLLVALLALAALAATAPGAAAARAPTAAAACGTRVDIGLTVFDSVHGVVKGSGSYTSQSCLAIGSVYLIIEQSTVPNSNYHGVTRTKVTRYPSEPSSAKFSPHDYTCFASSTAQYFKTKIKATYADGGTETKLSNYVIARCL
jgi:hypothetical protein